MALRFKLQLVVVGDDDQPVSLDELVVLDKDYERLEQLGLTLAEAKALLMAVQRQVVDRQIAAFLASRPARRAVKRHQRSEDDRLWDLVR